MIQTWQIIPTAQIKDYKTQMKAHRLNCFGSVFYLIKVVLRRHRLSNTLHRYMCSLLEQEHLKEIIEIPRAHYKTTIFSEGAPMWWALPFNDDDEAYMRVLGYGDEFIRWMRAIHDVDTNTLIVSSTISNAIKIGKRINKHYQFNNFFRELFPEIQPDSSCTWTDVSKGHKCSNKSVDGEGTYDFLGSGAQLQSRHYVRIVEDDLVGRDEGDKNKIGAISSSEIEEAIDYHRLLPGAFRDLEGNPDADNDEIVVGNRWGLRDLNSWIQENEPWFNVHTHSALGGCCSMHPVGVPIFSENFTKEKLERLAVRFGLYDFSCHYLNKPVNPGTTFFQENWLRYYKLEPRTQEDRRAIIRHEVKEGEVIKDVDPSYDLKIVMIADPNHAGNKGRCRHALSVLGYLEKPFTRLYLLDSWAESCSYETFVKQIYKVADFWRLDNFWLETVAAQVYLKLYLELRNKVEKRRLRVNELKIDYTPNAKARRIESMNPWFAEGNFFCRRDNQTDFILEYKQYPYGRTLDILDTIAYGPQVLKLGGTTPKSEIKQWLRQRQVQGPLMNVGIAGY